MRMRIIEAFKETDSDGSGTVEPVCASHARRCDSQGAQLGLLTFVSQTAQGELTSLLEKLEIDLKDKANDPAVIFQVHTPWLPTRTSTLPS